MRPPAWETFLQQGADFVSHLRAPQGALCFDAHMQAQGDVNSQAFSTFPASVTRAALNPLIRAHGRSRFGTEGDFLRHAANSEARAAKSSFTTASISLAACPSGVSSRTVLPRAALSAKETRWQTEAAKTGKL